VVVGGDRDNLSVRHGDLRVERGELHVQLVLLWAVMATSEREDQRIVALQLSLQLERPSSFQAAVCCGTASTSLRRPVSMSKTKPRTGTSFAIQGCDLTLLICSRVFCSGSL
jgi:hypothetical protein